MGYETTLAFTTMEACQATLQDAANEVAALFSTSDMPDAERRTKALHLVQTMDIAGVSDPLLFSMFSAARTCVRRNLNIAISGMRSTVGNDHSNARAALFAMDRSITAALKVHPSEKLRVSAQDLEDYSLALSLSSDMVPLPLEDVGDTFDSEDVDVERLDDDE